MQVHILRFGKIAYDIQKFPVDEEELLHVLRFVFHEFVPEGFRIGIGVDGKFLFQQVVLIPVSLLASCFPLSLAAFALLILDSEHRVHRERKRSGGTTRWPRLS
jgi:hypothetical protein